MASGLGHRRHHGAGRRHRVAYHGGAALPDRSPRLPSADAVRSARLLLSDAIAAGLVDEDGVRSAARSRRRPLLTAVPGTGALDRVAMKAGLLEYGASLVRRDVAARRRVLGGRADGPPRLLVRIDEFPHARAHEEPVTLGTDRFARFHDILSDAGVPYLVALVPRVSEGYLDPAGRGERALDAAEVAMIDRLRGEAVAFGLHGRNHRTRDARPRHRSEISGLPPTPLGLLLDDAGRELADATGVRPRVFVAPFNRFDRGQWATLARRFDVVTGGPESVRVHGFTPTPAWRGDAVYLPSYPPLYGSARQIAEGVTRLAETGAAVWAPAVIHWGAEQDDNWAGLRRAVATLARHAVPWTDLLTAVDASREATPPT